MRYRFWTVRIKAVQNWRCKTSGCALPFLVRQSYSRTILAVQNLRAVGYRFWSVRVTALHYWRCKTFGLCATVSGPSELQPSRTGGAKPSGCALPVPVRQLQPWKLHGFDRDVSMISLRIWRDLEEELLVCLKACLFIRVPKLKESTKNVSVTSQLLAHIYNSWFCSQQR